MAFGTFVPTVPDGSIPSALGLVGAVIMPHNLYLHSALVLTRSVSMGNYNVMRDAIIYNNIESGFSLFVSFIISTTVIATFAVYIINWKDAHPGEDVVDLDLQTAADALVETVGKSAQYIWAIGLLAAGQSSTMTGTYAG